MVRIVAKKRRMGFDVARRLRLLRRRTRRRSGVEREIRMAFNVAHRMRMLGNVAQQTGRFRNDPLVVFRVIRMVLYTKKKIVNKFHLQK